mgnify:CR=1 FL=1
MLITVMNTRHVPTLRAVLHAIATQGITETVLVHVKQLAATACVRVVRHATTATLSQAMAAHQRVVLRLATTAPAAPQRQTTHVSHNVATGSVRAVRCATTETLSQSMAAKRTAPLWRLATTAMAATQLLLIIVPRHAATGCGRKGKKSAIISINRHPTGAVMIAQSTIITIALGRRQTSTLYVR